MDGAAAPPRRRLPTKTSSGRITLPTAAAASTPSSPSSSTGSGFASVRSPLGDDFGADELNQQQPAAKPQALYTQCSAPLPSSAPSSSLDDTRQEIGCETCTSPAEAAHSPPLEVPPPIHTTTSENVATTTTEADARTSKIATSSQPASPPRSAAAARAAFAGIPSRTPKVPQGDSLTAGTLNSSSAPHVVALPVKRRGSYQSLKRNPGSRGDGGGEPSIVSLVKKTTHWERFGTILVLGCLYGDSETTVMQMLHAEGYDTEVAGDQARALEMFNEMETFPDIVLVDCDLPAFSSLQLITQFQALNPTVAIICLGTRGSTDAVSALMAGAADYMYRPVDLSELVARIERQVQRQHCVKLQLESVLEDTRSMMAQLSNAMALGNMISRGPSASLLNGAGSGRLIAVAETEFEQQITDLSDENQRLGSMLCELEERLERKVRENGEMAVKLNLLEVQIFATSSGMQGQLCMVAQQSNALIDKVDALERTVRKSQETARKSQETARLYDGVE